MNGRQRIQPALAHAGTNPNPQPPSPGASGTSAGAGARVRSPEHRKITGYCPACGSDTLFLASGGYPTCSLIHCPNPTALADIIADRETWHVVKIGDDGFTVRHPLIERAGGDLMECSLHNHIAGLSGPPARPGMYRVGWDEATQTVGPWRALAVQS